MTVRIRLTAWYALVLGVVLAAAGTITYIVVRQQLLRAADQELRQDAREIEAALAEEASENDGALDAATTAAVLHAFDTAERPVSLVRAGAPLPAFATRGGFRLHLPRIRVGGVPYVLAIGKSLRGIDDVLEDLREAMLFTIPLALAIASGGGYLLARKGLAPVAAMSAKARAIGAANLAERIEVANPEDELGQLAVTLNALLARLEESFTSQRRFMTDASHELRSPVAILQGELEVTLSRDQRDAADYRDSLSIMQRSVQRLSRIVRDLFLLARGDAGEVPLRDERFYVDETVSQTVHAFRTLAAERNVTLRDEHDPGIAVRGDEDLVQRLVGNLVDNAIKYTPRGGVVVVRCVRADGLCRIEVQDDGGGIAPELHERIFERFYRVDPSRTAIRDGNGSGAGLGLPIARWIAQAHHGSVQLERSGAGGSVFVATLPLA
jgi:heavy metal sensor kinase